MRHLMPLTVILYLLRLGGGEGVAAHQLIPTITYRVGLLYGVGLDAVHVLRAFMRIATQLSLVTYL
jgi:hypothetical protein